MADYHRIAGEYARHRGTHPEVLRCLRTRSGIGAASRVLEVGCGTGSYAAALRALAGCACWGIDPSEEMLARARARRSDVRFQEGRAESLAFADGFFDLVFSVDVIHHVSQCEVYLREAYRVLKPGGRLCTVTDSEEIIRTRRPLSLYFPETVPVELARYPRIAGLREAMRGVGFEGISEETVTYPRRVTDIQPYRDKAFSSLHLIPEAAFQRGLARMEEDLAVGPLDGISRYLLLWGVRPQRPL